MEAVAEFVNAPAFLTLVAGLAAYFIGQEIIASIQRKNWEIQESSKDVDRYCSELSDLCRDFMIKAGARRYAMLRVIQAVARNSNRAETEILDYVTTLKDWNSSLGYFTVRLRRSRFLGFNIVESENKLLSIFGPSSGALDGILKLYLQTGRADKSELTRTRHLIERAGHDINELGSTMYAAIEKSRSERFASVEFISPEKVARLSTFDLAQRLFELRKLP